MGSALIGRLGGDAQHANARPANGGRVEQVAEYEGGCGEFRDGRAGVKLDPPPPGPPFTPTFPNLLGFVREAYGDREFLVLDDRRFTYAEADARSAELAKGLLAMGLGKGARVGLLMPNDPDWVIAWMACARIGALTIALSTFYQPPEIAWGVRHNDVQVLLIASRFLKNDYLEKLERAVPGLAAATSPELYLPDHPYLRRIVVWGECDRPWAMRGPADILAAAAAQPAVNDALLARIEAGVTPSDMLVTICTSGTTSEPKAVVHSHGSALRATYQFMDYVDVRPDDRVYPAMPFFWIGGLNTHLIPAMYRGACVCCSRTPEPGDLIEMVQREKVTVIQQWPPQTRRLMLTLEETGQTLPSVRLGLPPQLDLLGRPMPADRQANGSLGMTESFGMHSMDRLDTPTPVGKAGSNGRKLVGMDRQIFDPETRAPLPRGERGELMIRGYNMMLGYYGKERWETFTRDGFFPTGDLATVDEDEYIWFHGRGGEMIKTSGANVAPQEVEVALAACPGVREAIVFGMPDEVKGEAVIAVVSAAQGSALDPESLRSALRETISPYKVPQSITIVTHEQIPRTASGKPIKHKLRDILFPENA
jgi:acyl-coenzyme A synthetase/AMP-(fatty) acid ligase